MAYVNRGRGQSGTGLRHGLLTGGVIVAGLGADWHGPSKECLAAFHQAQAAAEGRLAVQRAAFAKAVVELQRGRWHPREDLGACSANLPPRPAIPDAWRGYPGFVVDDPNPVGVAGWSRLTDRVFKELTESVGTVATLEVFRSEAQVVAETARPRSLDPANEHDVLVLFVDAVHRPKQVDE
jgi:hypothetical protein